jgi:hypothetical protein
MGQAGARACVREHLVQAAFFTGLAAMKLSGSDVGVGVGATLLYGLAILSGELRAPERVPKSCPPLTACPAAAGADRRRNVNCRQLLLGLD